MPVVIRQLIRAARAARLDYAARWHYRRLERHEALMLEHAAAISALQPAAAQLARELASA